VRHPPPPAFSESKRWHSETPAISPAAGQPSTRTDEGLACQLTTRTAPTSGPVIEAARVTRKARFNGKAAAEIIEAEAPGRPPLDGFQTIIPGRRVDGYHGQPFGADKRWPIKYDGGWGKIVAPALSELARRDVGQGLDPCRRPCSDAWSYVAAVSSSLRSAGASKLRLNFERLRCVRECRARRKRGRAGCSFASGESDTAVFDSSSTAKTTNRLLQRPAIYRNHSRSAWGRDGNHDSSNFCRTHRCSDLLARSCRRVWLSLAEWDRVRRDALPASLARHLVAGRVLD